VEGLEVGVQGVGGAGGAALDAHPYEIAVVGAALLASSVEALRAVNVVPGVDEVHHARAFQVHGVTAQDVHDALRAVARGVSNGDVAPAQKLGVHPAVGQVGDVVREDHF